MDFQRTKRVPTTLTTGMSGEWKRHMPFIDLDVAMHQVARRLGIPVSSVTMKQASRRLQQMRLEDTRAFSRVGMLPREKK